MFIYCDHILASQEDDIVPLQHPCRWKKSSKSRGIVIFESDILVHTYEWKIIG